MPNRLIEEQSPYLQQHAHNPVEWYPWGEEAFDRAEREDKPIFLSIGYSTCHWCHVMERESFEDPEVARLLNDDFVCIKVDREERPDIDAVYMDFCQMMTGTGGWPLTIIMRPDEKPFLAATYIPRESMFGMIGMRELLPRIAQAWKERRDEVDEVAERATFTVQSELTRTAEEGELGESIFHSLYSQCRSVFDPVNGGFGNAPRFPTPHRLMMLLRYWKRFREQRALEMVRQTLIRMRLGGIYDHIGHGFHRYSTDEEWFLPHFEKMLYDQALISLAYLEAFQATGDPLFRETAEGVIHYVLRDLTSEEGGFLSAEDADSEGVEGKFYTWTSEEVRSLLGEEADLVERVFDMREGGNYIEEGTGERSGANVLRMKRSIEDLADGLGLAPGELKARLERAREILFYAREERVHPLKDDKILTDWNGLMVASLSRAAAVLRSEEYLERATRAAAFLMENMVEGDSVYHRFRRGEVSREGFLPDYSNLIMGLLELYKAGFESDHLAKALRLSRAMIDRFWSPERGAFLLAPPGSGLVLDKVEMFDGAVPSGNSVAFWALTELYSLTGDDHLGEVVDRMVSTYSRQVKENPLAYTFFLSGLDELFDPRKVVIRGDPTDSTVVEMLDALRSDFLPGVFPLLHDTMEDLPELRIEGSAEKQGPAAMVCRGRSCLPPTASVEEMMRFLE
ncbi:MAG: thioredoxin domain-containing protein [Methanomassiliicoccales archaeon]